MGEDNESLRHEGRYVVVRDALVYVPGGVQRRENKLWYKHCFYGY